MYTNQVAVKGYTSQITGDSTTGFVVTNTHNVIIPSKKDKTHTNTGVNTGIKVYAGLSSACLGCLYILLKKKGKYHEAC